MPRRESLFEISVSCVIVGGIGGDEADDAGEAPGCDVEATGALAVQAAPMAEPTGGSLDMCRSRPGPGLSWKAAKRCAMRSDGCVLNLRRNAAMPSMPPSTSRTKRLPSTSSPRSPARTRPSRERRYRTPASAAGFILGLPTAHSRHLPRSGLPATHGQHHAVASQSVRSKIAVRLASFPSPPPAHFTPAAVSPSKAQVRV